jgi:ribosomal-protein-alanine N-acetyltransferase
MAVLIRKWSEDDIPSLAKHANNINIWNNLRNYFPHPYTLEHATSWINNATNETPLINMAIDFEGEAIGGIGLILNSDVYVLSAEIGYWISEEHWGKGIATEAIRQMLEYTFYYFDFIRIYAEVFENNKASMRALEKNGFYLEGVRRKSVLKNGILMDDYIWVKLRPY